jgi:hypothetical protein
MNDNIQEKKDLEPLKYKEYDITLSKTESFNTDGMEILFPSRSTQAEIKQYYKITNKIYPHDKVVTFQDLNSGNTIGTVKVIKGNFNEMYVVGLKPIIFESSQSYIEPENNNHFDFIFMVLLPFLVFVLTLRLRSKNKKK